MAKAELKRHPLNQSKFFRLRTRAKLAAVFGLSETALQAVSDMDRPYSERQMELEKNGKVKIRDIRLASFLDNICKLRNRIVHPHTLKCTPGA